MGRGRVGWRMEWRTELTSNNHLPTSFERQFAHTESAGVDAVVNDLGIWDGKAAIGQSNCGWIERGDGHTTDSPTDAAAWQRQ